MSGKFPFDPQEMDSITNHFGQDFYGKVLEDLDTYSVKWALDSFQVIPSYSVNLVVRCRSHAYGDVVLKIGRDRSVFTEFHALSEYDGRRFCKVLEADLERGVILEECVRPGTSLRNAGTLEERLSVFCSLYKGLHIKPANPEYYPSYMNWVSRITEYMSRREDCKELYLHMKKAKEIGLALSSSYSQKMLLHGDFHHDNILLGHDGNYRIIDPKGVIGDPMFDIPRFLLNEFEEKITPELHIKIKKAFSHLERSLQIPQEAIAQCLYVETAMGMCWCVEAGAGPDDFAKLLHNVAFAEALMSS